MDLKYQVIEEKYCQIIKRTYTSDSDDISISPNEHIISQVFVPQTNEFYIETVEYKVKEEKNSNFISKIRALTKEHEHLPFSQKYPFLALEIELAAKKGKNYTWYALTEKMEEDLRAEGFTIEGKPGREDCKISW